MIFQVPRHLLFLVLFVVIVSVERSLGLPIISLLFASLYLAPTERIFKTIGFLVCGGVLAVSYLIPFWLGIGAVVSLIFLLERRNHFLHSETVTIMSATLLVGICVGIVAKIPVSLNTVSYHFFLTLVSLLFIRWWLIKKMGKRPAT